MSTDSPPKIRNTPARSPLMRKGGVHARTRSAERSRVRQLLSEEMDEALEELSHGDEEEQQREEEQQGQAGQRERQPARRKPRPDA